VPIPSLGLGTQTPVRPVGGDGVADPVVPRLPDAPEAPVGLVPPGGSSVQQPSPSAAPPGRPPRSGGSRHRKQTARKAWLSRKQKMAAVLALVVVALGFGLTDGFGSEASAEPLAAIPGPAGPTGPTGPAGVSVTSGGTSVDRPPCLTETSIPRLCSPGTVKGSPLPRGRPAWLPRSRERAVTVRLRSHRRRRKARSTSLAASRLARSCLLSYVRLPRASASSTLTLPSLK